MTWANSKIFRPYLADVLGNITAIDLDADTFHAALYNNSITPDNDVTSANSAYNVGQWGTANEVTDATNWVAQRWLTPSRSCVWWDSWADLCAVHIYAHPDYGTRVEWSDGEVEAL